MDNGASSYRRFREDGDETALYEIIRDYKDGLIFYINSFVNNIHASEEIAEDTFLKLAIKKPRDKGKGSFRTWLYTIGRNTAIDYLRKNKSRTDVSLSDVADAVADEESLEISYIKEEKKIALHRAMGKLSSTYRQVLWLYYFEDMKVKEIALIMKTSTHNTEVILSRARKALKKELISEGFEYENL